MVCPVIDIISWKNFEYKRQFNEVGTRGGMDWNLDYKYLPVLPENLKKPSEPYKSPIMAGGLFAMSSNFFWELGGYDEELKIWGENTSGRNESFLTIFPIRRRAIRVEL